MKTNLLDFGYVEFIEHWGSDELIICAARMSTGKGFKGWGPGENGKPGDEKLLRYLWEHQHTTPFEMAGATFEIKAPIFVFREWHRHRTKSYNEMSARYIPIPDENYIPTLERLLVDGGDNRQAGTNGTEKLSAMTAECFLMGLEDFYAKSQSLYKAALDAGVPKELARIVLPVGRYSKMRASANLWNWLSFIRKRNSKDAQYEIRVYAEAVQNMLKDKFPRTLGLFEEGHK